MEKFFVCLAETVALLTFIIAMSLLGSFFFSFDLPSWLFLIFEILFLAAFNDVYALFEKLSLYIPIIFASVLLLILTVLSFVFLDLPVMLRSLLCFHSFFALLASFPLFKKVPNNYSGNFPLTYSKNIDLVYHSCRSFISASETPYTAEILDSFDSFFFYDFEPFSDFSWKRADIEALTLRTINVATKNFASKCRFYITRGDNEQWYTSTSTLIGSLFDVQFRMMNRAHSLNFSFPAKEGCGDFVSFVNMNYLKHKSAPASLTSSNHKIHIRTK